MEPPIYTPRHQPYAHQQAALDKCAGQQAFAFLAAPRCVDGETEYLSPIGWRKISEYKGGKVAEFRLDGTAHFVEPLEYIKSKADRFWHFLARGAVDQVLSDNHRILICTPAHRPPRYARGKIVGKVPDGFRQKPMAHTDYWREITPLQAKIKKDHFPTSFFMKNETKIDMTDDEIRLMVAFHADGTYGRTDISKITSRRHGYIRIKRPRKKRQIRKILRAVGRPWSEKKILDGFSIFKFKPVRITKTFTEEWWDASFQQKQIICDEVCKWDGRTLIHRANGLYYSSMHEADADFIQYCFSSTGNRASKNYQTDGTYSVCVTGGGKRNNLAVLPKKKEHIAHDGFMYSFSVLSTYLVLRRGGKVFVTGNTGKSKMLLDDYGRLELNDVVRSLLVLGPNGSLPPWEGACEEHLSDDLRKRYRFLLWQSGGSQKFKAELSSFLKHDGPKILAVNVEALSVVKEAQKLCIKFLDQEPCMIGFDESTTGKNSSSKRTKFIIKELAPRAQWKRIMSGLATPRSPLDLYSQFEFLNPSILGFRSYYAFRSRFALMRPMMFGGRAVQIVTGYRDLDELQARIEPYSYRVRLEDCYDMPPPQPFTRLVTLTAEQKRLYREMKESATTQLAGGSHVTATAVISQILRLHQILCGHTVDEGGKAHDIPENRTSELLDLLEEYSCKAIIWCAYDLDVRRIATALSKEYGDKAVARFWGGNRTTRESEEGLFKTSSDCRFMVATPDAGGRGRTWDVADLVVNYSYRNDLEKWDQGQDRPKGVGKVRPIVYATLVAPGTVEGPILKALQTKQSMAALINGDNFREFLI